MKLWVAPHNDDETLFGAFTLMREKPLVVIVTDSYRQENRGEHITAEQRRDETREAMKILGCPVLFLGIRDDCIDEYQVEKALSKFDNFEMVYYPAEIENGNEDHNLVSRVCQRVFKDKTCKRYMTYAKDQLYLVGTEESSPIADEMNYKDKALACYKSQVALPATAPHFEAVKGKSEWFT